MTLSVIVPTLYGREESLSRTLLSITETAPEELELDVVRDYPSCSEAWQAGADLATGDLLHFGADDLRYLPGWWQAARDICESGSIPAPLILNTDGSTQSCGATMDALEPDGATTTLARVALTLSREQWEAVKPLPPLHYFAENYVAWAAARAGIRIVVCHGYSFVHDLAMTGVAQEGDWQERIARDRERFKEIIAR